MSSIFLRPYQMQAQAAAFHRFRSGDFSTLVVLPTGTGKTVLAGSIIREAWDDLNRRALFLAHREELISQAAATFAQMEIDTAIEMADQDARWHSTLYGLPAVVVASVQTLQRDRLQTWDPNTFGMIVTDECHHVRAKSYRRIYDYFQNYWHVGITATPDRGDGKNLGAVFQSLAFDYPLRTAILEGWLVPLVTARLHTNVDLKGIKTTGGDYNEGDLAERVGPAIEELADATAREIGARQTVVFTPDVRSACGFADVLTKKGVLARYVAGTAGDHGMAKEERRRTLREFAAREFQVIVCCDLLTEGWDCPAVSCVVVARPTRKRNRYAQMIGRGTRPCPEIDKADCLVIDFAWETTSDHELVTPIDLFDDSDEDDEVIEEAHRLVKEGRQTNVMEAIEEARQIVKSRFTIKLTGKKATYRKFVFDPVGVGGVIGVPIKRGWDFDPSNPATPRQLQALRNMGVAEPDGLSRFGAGKMIDKLKKRIDNGLATVKQVQFLINLGVEPGQARTMTFEQASQSIDELLHRRKGA